MVGRPAPRERGRKGHAYTRVVPVLMQDLVFCGGTLMKIYLAPGWSEQIVGTIPKILLNII